VDNGSSHNGARSIERMQTAWPTATLVHLPVHASWLNQVEIYFSILQRKAISPSNFRDLDELAERITACQDRYNPTAEPFDWTYTRAELNAYLKRLTDHEPESRTAPGSMTPDELTGMTTSAGQQRGHPLRASAGWLQRCLRRRSGHGAGRPANHRKLTALMPARHVPRSRAISSGLTSGGPTRVSTVLPRSKSWPRHHTHGRRQVSARLLRDGAIGRAGRC